LPFLFLFSADFLFFRHFYYAFRCYYFRFHYYFHYQPDISPWCHWHIAAAIISLPFILLIAAITHFSLAFSPLFAAYIIFTIFIAIAIVFHIDIAVYYYWLSFRRQRPLLDALMPLSSLRFHSSSFDFHADYIAIFIFSAIDFHRIFRFATHSCQYCRFHCHLLAIDAISLIDYDR